MLLMMKTILEMQTSQKLYSFKLQWFFMRFLERAHYCKFARGIVSLKSLYKKDKTLNRKFKSLLCIAEGILALLFVFHQFFTLKAQYLVAASWLIVFSGNWWFLASNTNILLMSVNSKMIWKFILSDCYECVFY